MPSCRHFSSYFLQLIHYQNILHRLFCLKFKTCLDAQCTDSDGCAVDRARAWCEMIDTIYHRSADRQHATFFAISWFFSFHTLPYFLPTYQLNHISFSKPRSDIFASFHAYNSWIKWLINLPRMQWTSTESNKWPNIWLVSNEEDKWEMSCIFLLHDQLNGCDTRVRSWKHPINNTVLILWGGSCW